MIIIKQPLNFLLLISRSKSSRFGEKFADFYVWLPTSLQLRDPLTKLKVAMQPIYYTNQTERRRKGNNGTANWEVLIFCSVQWSVGVKRRRQEWMRGCQVAKVCSVEVFEQSFNPDTPPSRRYAKEHLIPSDHVPPAQLRKRDKHRRLLCENNFLWHGEQNEKFFRQFSWVLHITSENSPSKEERMEKAENKTRDGKTANGGIIAFRSLFVAISPLCWYPFDSRPGHIIYYFLNIPPTPASIFLPFSPPGPQHVLTAT